VTILQDVVNKETKHLVKAMSKNDAYLAIVDLRELGSHLEFLSKLLEQCSLLTSVFLVSKITPIRGEFSLITNSPNNLHNSCNLSSCCYDISNVSDGINLIDAFS